MLDFMNKGYFNKTMNSQNSWIRDISMNICNVSADELWLFQWKHAWNTKIFGNFDHFLWNHEICNSMNCLFDETMKGQTLWYELKLFNETMKHQILQTMNYEMSAWWSKPVSMKPWNAEHQELCLFQWNHEMQSL